MPEILVRIYNNHNLVSYSIFYTLYSRV